MKKILLLLIAFVSVLTINSCREDGDWGNDNTGQFGFTIQRDTNFIEKSVGETNQLTFNIIPNYDFATIPTTFKFTTNLNGVLSLNGQTLIANQEYTFDTKDNIFNYVGNVTGTHQLKISVKNSKGANKEEEFSLSYGISEFTHTFTGGTAPIYQGDETNYLMKIVPGSGQPNTGYQIKFNTYTGALKLNGVAATLGQFYALPNIDNFSVTTATNQAGNGALFYTIKNGTVTKDYSIQQNILPRTITVESMSVNSLNVAPNASLSLIGVIKKTPITTNNNVEYKTWISSASNNNTAGIQNTSNVYVPYTLGANGSFTYNFNAIAVGTYTYNIQFKDEYGNESVVTSYTIVVESTMTITTAPTVAVTLQRLVTPNTAPPFGPIPAFPYTIKHNYQKAVLNLVATSNAGNGISKIVFDLNFTYNGQLINKSYTYNYSSFPQTVNLGYVNTNDAYQLYTNPFSSSASSNPINASDGTFTVTIFDKFNSTTVVTGVTSVNTI